MIADGESYRLGIPADLLKFQHFRKWCFQQPFTVVAITSSILFPLVALLWLQFVSQQEKPARGLPFQLLKQSRLIQSFVVDPNQAVPAIWSQRLGDEEASSRWMSSARRLWWLAWLEDGEPLLLLSAVSRSEPPTFHFADELHRDTYRRKRSSKAMKPSKLEADCLSRLNSTTAVKWSSSALISIAGPTASVMNEVSHGCVSLSLKADVLSFRGPVAPRSFSAAPENLSSPDVSGPERPRTTRSDQSIRARPLLQLSSRSSDRLLSTFTNRQVIREQLEKRYGVSPLLLRKVLQAPMQLVVRPESSGPYRAGLQVALQLESPQAKEVEQTLDTIASLLRQRGLRQRSVLVKANGKGDLKTRLIWMDGDRLMGGWSVQGAEDSLTLQLALGQTPTPLTNLFSDFRSTDLTLKMLPSKLSAIGWIGSGWPRIVREAKSLELQVVPMNGHSSGPHWGWVEGELSLR